MANVAPFDPFDPANDHKILNLVEVAKIVNRNTRTVRRWTDPKLYAEPLETQRLPDGARVTTWAKVRAFGEREGGLQAEKRRERSTLPGCQ